ncbi:MAG: extracellular solute-binding protein [Lachnospiraceae bacterium]|nr:extracellular solute-binding protein [Lachnospiraceae bacterium]
MKKKLLKSISIICSAALVFSMAACGGKSGSDSDEKDSQEASEAGSAEAEEAEEAEASTGAAGDTEITVMIPSWGEPSQELLDEFTSETGIGVTMEIVGWDDIRDKVSIAAVGETAPADVLEVDWSWVGEFGAADWLEPVEMTDEEIEGMPTVSSFMYNSDVVAVPYSNDYRMAYYNTVQFNAAGVPEAAGTWDELIEQCKQIKEAGVCDYPIGCILSATEATTTSLFWFTLSGFGDFFNDDNSINKENLTASLTALNGLVEDGLIDPASLSMTDVEVEDKLTSGDVCFEVSTTNLVGKVNNEEYSSVIGEVAATLIPGNGSTITSASYALPEGIGISKYSENKDAALQFVQWYTSADTQTALYKELGNIPTQTEALENLVTEGLIDEDLGNVMIDQSAYIESPFPNGIPTWYAEMSNAIYNNVNQMVAGSLTPQEACAKISDKVDELNQ